ncbi:PREDICTED: bactericidal permeability-increasing protein-like [Gekko japonicus]|uniref:Bactericidal permeability-increasing protein n=1 Tax=Gekko japonicus TaxID=146911 RepID=A0ABM1LAM1_GEKJA|nr:PREDICTED: bactericidal permeability-increasing protein-like [Gekko japonicus]
MAQGNTLWTALLVSLSLMLVEGTNPGIVGRITGKGLDYARQEGVAVLQRELARVKLPNFSGSFEALVLGNIEYRFHSLKIESFQLLSSTIAPVPSVGLKVSVTNAFAEVSGEWQWKNWMASDHGSFDVKIKGLSISVGLKLGNDSAGRLTADSSACSTHISNVQVHIDGTWSWLYNLFDSQVESALREAMEDQVCKVVSSSVSSRLEPYLQTLPVTAKIDKVSGIDYSLVGPPVATSDSLDLDLKGEFFSLAHRSAAPFPPPALPVPEDHDRMLYFGISSYLFNTAGYVYYQAGALTYDLTDNMIPKESKLRLNTSSFGSLVPQIEKLYPSMLMKLVVSPSSPPSLAVAPEGLSLAPTVDLQAFAILPNSSLAPLFLLDVSTTISATAAVESNKIVGSLKIGRLELSLKHSDVGPFSVKLMQVMVNYFAANILLPQINERLAQGFPLPLPDDLQLSNTVLQPHQNFLYFGTDVHYG